MMVPASILLSFVLLALAMWLLVAHKRRHGGSLSAVDLHPVADCLCRHCGAAALAGTAPITKAGSNSNSSALAEATLRRKRMWAAQRGEEFLRKVMFGRRSAGLTPLPGSRCRQCNARLSSEHAPQSLRKLKTQSYDAQQSPTSGQDDLQYALDLADAMMEEHQLKAASQRHAA